jgi:hypothetical protein
LPINIKNISSKPAFNSGVKNFIWK